MRRRPVESSSLRAVGYDPDERVLEVEFHNDRVYRYFGVARAIHRRLLAAGSKGRFFNRFVRDRYEYEWVE
ncbi:KTSC domain-containing protein [Amycolatopsis arida]|uniref:KTSC domain-containing protein n=1 Tax=Amycolatopsis arida TaxID=587909 RepID=A0A1I5M0P6_9PSEU|nr:KTSC domain-containing protein [Amycolatopsis arida]TDX93906.1 KTSC domain-containing protein [Amycolatopsis arida]SFP02596.1 KTSC domain-containing protein [Amycolatopsis arida]